MSESRVSGGSDVPSAGDGTGGRNRAGVPLEAMVAAALAGPGPGVPEGLEGLEVGQKGGSEAQGRAGARPRAGLERERAVHASPRLTLCRDGQRADPYLWKRHLESARVALGSSVGGLAHRAVSVSGSAVRGWPSRFCSWASGRSSRACCSAAGGGQETALRGSLASPSSLASAAWLSPAQRERERPGSELSPWPRPHPRL